MTSEFFSGPREHFFRPLTWQDRECYVEVLKTLFERVHGPNADYSEVLTRELVISLILHVLSEPRLRVNVFASTGVIPVEEERQQASKILLGLKEHGWIEDQRDPIDLKPTLKLTRAGKEFSEVFSNLDNTRAKTRQRN